MDVKHFDLVRMQQRSQRPYQKWADLKYLQIKYWEKKNSTVMKRNMKETKKSCSDTVAQSVATEPIAGKTTEKATPFRKRAAIRG